ncbi:MAG: 5-bromo-4-chloroindolyl phosphate hydrolysis family protein [Defluviitaleaceae bacterium]|nr:5-bromo-4-chloroindolyl phosphate hydrolysis family protein [Defluviitaleaceae bacterium]
MKCTFCNRVFEEKDIVTLDKRQACVKCARAAMMNPSRQIPETNETFGFFKIVKLAALSFIPIFPWGLNYFYVGKGAIAVVLLLLYAAFTSLTLTFFGGFFAAILVALPIRFITFIHAVSLRNEYSKTRLEIFESRFPIYLVFLLIGTALDFMISRLFINIDVTTNLGVLAGAIFMIYVAVLARKVAKKDNENIITVDAVEKEEKTQKKDKTSASIASLSEEKQLAQKLREYTLKLSGTKLHKNLVSLSQTTDKIILFLSENERKRRNLNKFFEYCLPTTLDLLNKYEILLKHGKAGENVETSKNSIESLMQELENAFLNQFDMLFEDKKIDIDADISVMKNIMEKEGLLGEV